MAPCGVRRDVADVISLAMTSRRCGDDVTSWTNCLVVRSGLHGGDGGGGGHFRCGWLAGTPLSETEPRVDAVQHGVHECEKLKKNGVKL